MNTIPHTNNFNDLRRTCAQIAQRDDLLARLLPRLVDTGIIYGGRCDDNELYVVQSPGKADRVVTVGGGRIRGCTCEDYRFRDRVCVHMAALAVMTQMELPEILDDRRAA